MKKRIGRQVRLWKAALSAHVTADVRELLSLPELSAADRECVRHQRHHRGRSCAADPGHPDSGRHGAQWRESPDGLSMPDCRVAVWSEYGRPEARFVRAGTLETPSEVTPGAHIFTRSKVPWLTAPGVDSVVRDLLRLEDALAGREPGASKSFCSAEDETARAYSCSPAARCPPLLGETA